MIGRVTIRRLACVVALGVVIGLPSPGSAQPRDPLAGLSGDLTPVEVQRLFDAFELVRAEEMLGLSDEQYPGFVVGLKSLQDARRSTQRERQQQLRELQRLLREDNVDDSTLADRLRTLAMLEAEATEAQRDAVAEIDSILTVRQRAMFRLFEQAMERRRVELLTRARRQGPRR